MIFAGDGHIEMIRDGIKTQTRRLNRGVYKVGNDYAVQCKRGVKAEPDIRIVMDGIWKEDCLIDDELGKGGYFLTKSLSKTSAWVEGGYTPEEFEKLFLKINPNWNGIIRYGFEFHVIEVQR